MTMTTVGWAMKMGLAAQMPAIAASLLVSVTSLLVIAALSDLLHRVEAAGWSFAEPRLSRWAVFYGAWGVVGLGIGLGRVAVLEAKSGAPLTSGRASFVVAVCLYMTWLMLWALENQAMFMATIARKQASSRRAASFLLRTREAFILARDRRRHEALDVMKRRVESELAAIQERVAKLPAEGLATPEVENLLERLDHLRDSEIREVSHLLHPSIIDLGLAPALRALVRNRSDEHVIRLEADHQPADALSPAAALHLYRIVEHALDLARDQGVGEMRVSLARGDPECLDLEVVLRAVGLDLARARESGAQALMDARVALLRGAWSLERREDDRVVLRVSCPLAPATLPLRPGRS
jgi:signal transduction histidine kinase